MPEETLERVDPMAPQGVLRRAYARALSTSAGRWLGMNVASKVDPWLMSWTNGRMGLALMLPHALLKHRGARSGEPRANPVFYFHDGDDVVIIASNYGRPKHPAWYHNVRANPDVRLGGVPLRAEPVEDSAERARLWDLADRLFPGYADYRKHADSVGRRIPIFRLR